MDRGGEWIIGSQVLLDPPSRGREKVVRMAASAIAECLPALKDTPAERVPLLLCIAEEDRPGRIPGLNGTLLSEISERLGTRFSARSAVIANGRVGGVEAILHARQLIDERHPYCLVAAADSFLVAATLGDFEQKQRLLTSQNSNGFIPGEAGAAVLVSEAQENGAPQLICRGLGFAKEKSHVESEEPLRADGLAAAIRAALGDAICTFDDVDYRLVDVSGEQYGFKEADLGIARTMKKVKPEFDIWHPADCIGEVGAAVVPCVLSVAKAAGEKGYAPGPGTLCHFGNDDGLRAALILRYDAPGAD